MGKPLTFRFPGIKQIKIPKEDVDFQDYIKATEILNKFMPSILMKHRFNRLKIFYCRSYALGNQDITTKRRLYNKDSKNNNRITENHSYRQTEFKTGFITSERRDYAHKSGSHDDMIYLDRYLTDCDFFAKDKDLKEWVYQTGIGVSYVSPRRDIVSLTEDNKYQFRTRANGFDIETEAPFTFDVLDPADNFVVYSSMRGNEPLFCVQLVRVEKEGINYVVGTPTPQYEYLLYIETRYARFTAKCSSDFGLFKDLRFEMFKSINDMPMVEHSTNSARLGLVELNRDLFNSINLIVSNCLDLIVDNANVIMVFKNTDVDQQTIADMKNKGAILLHDVQDNKNNSEAKLDVIRIEIPFEGLNSFYEERVSQAYDIAGVPLASGMVTSGGDTGQARLLGGGWNNAYVVIKNDITSLLRGDYAVLKSMLKICKNIPNCPLDKIAASEIEIKYRINQSDNLLVRAQSISELYHVNMPKEEILKATGLFSDVCTVANNWEKSDAQAKEEALKEAEAKLAVSRSNLRNSESNTDANISTISSNINGGGSQNNNNPSQE